MRAPLQFEPISVRQQIFGSGPRMTLGEFRPHQNLDLMPLRPDLATRAVFQMAYAGSAGIRPPDNTTAMSQIPCVRQGLQAKRARIENGP
jgi:hypothetical protein